MKYLFYTHSLISDWNHGNAHFLRGVMRALQRRGHTCESLEPAESWSRVNLIAEKGHTAVEKFKTDFPTLHSTVYADAFDHAEAVSRADVVVVHEWTKPSTVATLGALRRKGGQFTLLFHDTHHRAVSAATDIGSLALDDYDGVLAFGESLRERYLRAGWGSHVFTWHEAADLERFTPQPHIAQQDDLVWVGNWGDNDRSAELHEYLIEPSRALKLRGNIFGVRYPQAARDALADADLCYRGWIANADVPACFARHRVTVHIPRRPYVAALPGIPTIRIFEALACGIPLICAPWTDSESLFRPGTDFLVAQSGDEMKRLLADVLTVPEFATQLARCGLETIRARHTCEHRAVELEAIVARLRSACGPAEQGQ